MAEDKNVSSWKTAAPQSAEAWDELTSDEDFKALPAAQKRAYINKFQTKILIPEVGKHSPVVRDYLQQEGIVGSYAPPGLGSSVTSGLKSGFASNLTGAMVGAKGDEDAAGSTSPWAPYVQAGSSMVGALADPAGLAINAITGGVGGKLASSAIKAGKISARAGRAAAALGAGAVSGGMAGGVSTAAHGGSIADIAKQVALGAGIGSLTAGRSAKKPTMIPVVPEIPRALRALPMSPLEADLRSQGYTPREVAAEMASRRNASVPTGRPLPPARQYGPPAVVNAEAIPEAPLQLSEHIAPAAPAPAIVAPPVAPFDFAPVPPPGYGSPVVGRMPLPAQALAESEIANARMPTPIDRAAVAQWGQNPGGVAPQGDSNTFGDLAPAAQAKATEKQSSSNMSVLDGLAKQMSKIEKTAAEANEGHGRPLTDSEKRMMAKLESSHDAFLREMHSRAGVPIEPPQAPPGFNEESAAMAQAPAPQEESAASPEVISPEATTPEGIAPEGVGAKLRNIVTNEQGSFDPHAFVNSIKTLPKTAKDAYSALMQAKNVNLRSSVERTKAVSRELGNKLQQAAASRNDAEFLSRLAYEDVFKPLTQDDRNLLAEFLVSERGPGEGGKIPDITAEQRASMARPEMRSALDRWKNWQQHSEDEYRKLGGQSVVQTPSGAYTHLITPESGRTLVRGKEATGEFPIEHQNTPQSQFSFWSSPSARTPGRLSSRGQRERIGRANTSQTMGTGTAYETDPLTLTKELFQNHRKAAILDFFDEGVRRGLLKPALPGQKAPRSMTIDGTEYPVRRIEFNHETMPTQNDSTGEITPGDFSRYFYAPEPVAKDYDTLTQKLQPTLSEGLGRGLSKIGGAVTGLSLQTPSEATKHAWRLISTLSGDPHVSGIDPVFLRRAIPYFGPKMQAIHEMSQVGPGDLPLIKEIVKGGGARLSPLEDIQGSSAGTHWMNVLKKSVFDYPDELKSGYLAMLNPRTASWDLRARVASVKLAQAKNPKMNIAEKADWANRFGNYTADLQSSFVRSAKNAQFNFMGYQSQSIPTEIGQMVGAHGLPGSSKLPVRQQLEMVADQVWAKTAGTALAATALNMAFNGKPPWEIDGLKSGDIRVTVAGHPFDIPLASIEPGLARAMRFTPARAMIEASKGSSPSDTIGRFFAESYRDSINDIMAEAGPLYGLIGHLGGAEKYLPNIRPGEAPQFMASSPKAKTIAGQAGTNVAFTALRASPLVGTGYDIAAPFLGLPETRDPRFPAHNAALNAGMRAIDAISPINVHEAYTMATRDALGRSDRKPTRIDNEVGRLSLNLGAPSRSILGQQLSPDQYNVLAEQAANSSRERLDRLMDLPAYRDLDDETKKIRIHQIVAEETHRVRQRIAQELGIHKNLTGAKP